MHPFGKLNGDLTSKLLLSDLSNININRKRVFFPSTVVRVDTNAVIVTGYMRNYGKIAEYDIILKLASANASSFRDIF